MKRRNAKIDKIVGPKFKEIRKEANISLKELAQKVGVVSTSTLSRWERGEEGLPVEIFEKLLTSMNISYTRLNSANSDIYIHTSDIEGSNNTSSDAKPTTPAEPVTKTLMHTAILYNSEGKSLGKKYYSYRKISVLPDTVDINGSEYYKLALGANYDEAYIKASNTLMVLSVR